MNEDTLENIEETHDEAMALLIALLTINTDKHE